MDSYTYLVQRGVSDQIIQQFQLKWDPKRHMIVAPYWDVHGRFAGARGRLALGPDTSMNTIAHVTGSYNFQPQKHYDYSFQGVNNARLCWYNEQVLNLPGPVVVVEGQFDLWKTVQVFPKTVACLTSKPTREKMKKLGDSGTVIQIPDRDEAGRQSIGTYAQVLSPIGTRPSSDLVG